MIERVENRRGIGYRGQSGFIFGFNDEASERYARLLAESPFGRWPKFIWPEIQDGKLVLESSGRRVIVEPETWEGLQNALVEIHFQYSPPKVPRVSQSSA